MRCDKFIKNVSFLHLINKCVILKNSIWHINFLTYFDKKKLTEATNIIRAQILKSTKCVFKGHMRSLITCVLTLSKHLLTFLWTALVLVFFSYMKSIHVV